MEMLDLRMKSLLAGGGEPGPPQHNLFGQQGPRCPTCSGMGRFLALGTGSVVRSTTRCSCRGTGIDEPAVLRGQISSLVDRLAEMERREIQRAKRLNAALKAFGTTKRPIIKNSRQFWSECIAWSVVDGTAIANTTTEAIIFPNVIIPGNYLADGRVLRLRSFGKYSTTSAPTGTWALRYNGVGGTVLATTETITLGTTLTNVNWAAELIVQTRTNGSSGALLVMGEITVQTNASGDPTTKTNVFSVSGSDAPAQVGSLDLTADTPLSWTFDWSAASASNTLTGMIYLVESLN